MIRPSVIAHLRRGRPSTAPDPIQLSDTVVPLPTASMRILEFTLAGVALGFAALLGLAR